MSNVIAEALKALTAEIKAKFSIEEPAPAAFIVVTTAEGMELTLAGDLVAGVSVTVKDAEGVESPAPDGEYTLADGTKLEIAGGTVKEVAAPPAPEENPAMPQEDIATALSAVEQAVNAIADKFNALNDRIAELEAKEVTGFAKEDEVNELKNMFSKLVPLLEGLAEVPASEPVNPNKFKAEQNKKDDKINQLADVLASIKK